MAEATMTTVTALLKEIYEGRIESQLQNEVVARRRIERSSAGITSTAGGKYVDFPIRVKRNTGISYRAELESLGEAGAQGYAEVHVPLQYGYGRVKATGQLMELAEENFQAFASALDEEMEGIKDDIAKDENRIVYGDSSGLMASVTADGANTVTVDNVQYLEIGMRIDIRTRSNGAAVISDRLITAINEDTLVVTYDGADGTAASTEGIYRQGSYTSGTKREPQGFAGIVSATSILHGLDPASEAKWKSIVKTNPAGSGTNRALSETIMIETCDAVRRKGGKTSAIFTSLGVRRSYFNLLTQQRRQVDTKEFAGGFVGLPFNYGSEIPVVEDTDAPPNKMWFIMESALKIYRSRPWYWADKDGSIFKWVVGFDVWEALMKCYQEMGTNRRNGHGLLADITES